MPEYIALPALAAELGTAQARELLEVFAVNLKLDEDLAS